MHVYGMYKDATGAVVNICSFSCSSPQFIDTPGLIPGLDIGKTFGLESNITISGIYRYVILIHLSQMFYFLCDSFFSSSHLRS